jgi:hypothetical protein
MSDDQIPLFPKEESQNESNVSTGGGGNTQKPQNHIPGQTKTKATQNDPIAFGKLIWPILFILLNEISSTAAWIVADFFSGDRIRLAGWIFFPL